MKTPLIEIDVPSIYKHLGVPVPLPKRLAQATPDLAAAIVKITEALAALGGRLVLSDLFRTHDMQMQAHIDYATGKKKAYSPPPVGSFHESGRAMDISLSDLRVPLGTFWDVAKKFGVNPIIDSPNRLLKY